MVQKEIAKMSKNCSILDKKEFEESPFNNSFVEHMAKINAQMVSEANKKEEELIAEVREYSRHDAVSKVAALLCFRDLFPNTIRIEYFLHLLVRYSNGSKEINRGRINQVLNKKLINTHWSHDEDPSEEVFASNIAIRKGNYIVLDGIWASNVFFTQQALETVEYMKETSFKDLFEIYEDCVNLLKASDYVLNSLGVKAYEATKGRPKGEIPLPNIADIEKAAKLLTFDEKKLNELSIKKSSLEKFVLKNEALLTTDVNMETQLHSKPVIKIDDKYVIAIHQIGFAIRKYILASLEILKLTKVFSDILAFRQASYIFNMIKEEAIDIERPVVEGLPKPIHDMVFQIDIDKSLHVVFLPAELEGKHDKNWASFDKTDEKIFDYINEVSKILKKQFDSGLIVIVVSSLGGGWSLGVLNETDQYHCCVLSLEDFQTLLFAPDFSFLKLWKMKMQQQKFLDSGGHIMNIDGDFNLYCYWNDNNNIIIPSSKIGSLNMMTLLSDFQLPFRENVKKLHNFHAVELTSQEDYIPVFRKNIDTYFLQDNQKQIYISHYLLMSRLFYFLVECGDNVRIWVTLDLDKYNKVQKSFFYTICETILFWLEKGKTEISKLVSDYDKLIMTINLNFENFDDYPYNTIDVIPYSEKDITVKFTVPDKIGLFINSSFLRDFHKPTNDAEKNIMRNIVGCMIYMIRGQDDNISLEQIINSMFGSDPYNRQQHMFYMNDFRDMVMSKEMPKPIWLKDEDLNYVRDSIVTTHSGIIRDKQVIKSILNEKVDDLYKSLINDLKNIDRIMLIEKCVKNHESASCELRTWQRTTRSLIASASDVEERFDGIKSRYSLMQRAILCSRVLSEVGLCECKGKNAISETQFGMLLAKVAVLMELATTSDAVDVDIISPYLNINDNGNIITDQGYIDTILAKYHDFKFDDKIKKTIEVYPNMYVDPNSKQSKERPKIDAKFEKAFFAEFGFNIDTLVESYIALANKLEEVDEIFFYCTKEELVNILLDAGIIKAHALNYIDKLTLFPRDKFEFSSKDRYSKNNNIWRFKRPLSLTAKPLIALDSEAKDFLILPSMVGEIQGRIFTRAYLGELDEEVIISNEMRKYIGYKKNQLGQSFNDDVANLLQSEGLIALSNKKMTELGANKKIYEDLGDVDVLAFDMVKKTIYVVECKNLEAALTAKEIGEQIKRFLDKKDRWLDKHLSRYRWIKQNINEPLKRLKIEDNKYKIVPILAVNDVIALQFKDNIGIPKPNIITLSNLSLESLQKTRECK